MFWRITESSILFGGFVAAGALQVQDLVEQLTGEQVAFGREVGAMVVKNSKWGRRLVDVWVEAGTGDGCRYRNFPFNHMSQSINADMYNDFDIILTHFSRLASTDAVTAVPHLAVYITLRDASC